MKVNLLTSVISLLLGMTIANAASPFKESGNLYIHQPSSVCFPERVGLFRRYDGHTIVYDRQGRDISKRYVLDELIICDVYVYPPGGRYGTDVSSEFSHQQTDIRATYKGVRLISESRAQTTQNGRTIEGRRAVYELVRALIVNERPRKCGSQLFVFRDGQWFVAYRFSYPIEKSAVANQHIANFIAQWKWRER